MPYARGSELYGASYGNAFASGPGFYSPPGPGSYNMYGNYPMS
jgi:hypothetical protein